ncbi:MAG TPA: hypothetical protein PLN21_04075 [Gemmatales bacterium]|nr:hypothetical protein [Gemmatales bacterium]
MIPFSKVMVLFMTWSIPGSTVLFPFDDPAGNSLPNTPGLHNVFRITEKLLSGSVPEGDTGFQTLQKLGVKTIVTVDGAKPEVERAKKFGMRYVHLPIGYDGVPVDQGLRLAKAVRDLPGLIYMHCHHGKHRSPAAAVVVKLCLDEKCTVATALELMKQAGTDSKYIGLYASPRELRRPSSTDLDKVSSDFPEVTPTGGLVQPMVEIDERWDHLKLIQAAGWTAPRNHPDLDPAHEALLLREHYVELARLSLIQKKPQGFRDLISDAETTAKQLESILRTNTSNTRVKEADQAFKTSQSSCTKCHAHYRDVPQK